MIRERLSLIAMPAAFCVSYFSALTLFTFLDADTRCTVPSENVLPEAESEGHWGAAEWECGGIVAVANTATANLPPRRIKRKKARWGAADKKDEEKYEIRYKK